MAMDVQVVLNGDLIGIAAYHPTTTPTPLLTTSDSFLFSRLLGVGVKWLVNGSVEDVSACEFYCYSEYCLLRQSPNDAKFLALFL